MIRTIKGKIIIFTPPQIVVEAGGIGYGVSVPLSAAGRLVSEQDVFLHVHHHIAEDKQQLYGFLDQRERDFFELLLTVSGVGPKVALAVVGSNNLDALRSAIAQGSADIFKNVSGIGRKIAERIVVDLKTKVGAQPEISSAFGDTYEALIALGYTPAEVKAAINSIPPDIKDVQEQVRLALKSLAR